MKKRLFTIAICLWQFSGANASEQGTISYTGKVTGGTCEVTVNGEEANNTITLPTITANELNDKKETGKTLFHFIFSHCAGTLEYVQPYFDGGSTVDTTNYYLKNVNGTASGVALILRTPGGAQIKPGTDVQAGGTKWQSGVDVKSGDYSVAYITDPTTGPATGGTVNSSIVYHLEYH